MNFDSVRLITFDCYGTLIDWEAGLLAVLGPLFSGHGQPISDAGLLELYGEIEAELEAGPYLLYKRVLSGAAQQIGQRLGVKIAETDAVGFAESLPGWDPFPDTVSSLKALAKRFRLGIISNVDDDLFDATKKKLEVDFDVIVTAQQVQSYKPSIRNFQEAVRRSGLEKQQILHAGQSVYHDVIPASSLGITSVWVNRPSKRPNIGAVKVAALQPEFQVHSLAELAALLNA